MLTNNIVNFEQPSLVLKDLEKRTPRVGCLKHQLLTLQGLLEVNVDYITENTVIFYEKMTLYL